MRPSGVAPSTVASMPLIAGRCGHWEGLAKLATNI
jgi:hypothetical protein